MKETFYFLLTMIICGAILFICLNKREYIMPEEYKGGIIIEKGFPQALTILKNGEVSDIICYDILYQKYNVGDTIK